MSNIFRSKDEAELVKDRQVRPVKGNPSSGTQTAPVTPEPAPELSQVEPEVSTEPDKASQSSNSPVTQPQPDFYQAPIPFAPPIGYEPVQSSPFAFQQQDEIFQGIQEAGQSGNAGALMPLLERDTTVNPAMQSIDELAGDPLRQAEEWSERWTGRIKEHWDRHITHSNVGINPATRFDAAGNPIKHATEQEIRTGLNGLTSELGQSLQQNFDKGNWFTNSITGMKGLVPMVKSFFESVPGAVAAIPGMPNVLQGGLSLFNVPDDYLEQNRKNIEAHKTLFYANVRGDMNAANEARMILQNNPLKQEYNDFGDGALGTVFRTLSIPDNLTMATVYEYADGWRQLMDNRDKRTFWGNVEASLGAAAGTLRGTEKEFRRDSNRWTQIASGRDLSTFQRWTDEKYLTTQEPEDLEMGTMSGNWWWDVPENIMLLPDNLKRLSSIITTGRDPGQTEQKPWDSFGGYMTLAMLHNVLQGVPAFMGSIVADAPFDLAVDSLWHAARQKGKALSSLPIDDVPVMEVRRMTDNRLPPGTRLALPAADGSTAAYMGGVTIDVQAVPITDSAVWGQATAAATQPAKAAAEATGKSGFKHGLHNVVPDPWNQFEVVADPWDLTPNSNKAQIHLVPQPPQLLPGTELDFVYRSNEDLAALANRMGFRVEATDAQINELMRIDPDRFARYGKPISPEMRNFQAVTMPDGAVIPLEQVAAPPISVLTPEQQLVKMNNAGSNMTEAQSVIADSLRRGEIPPERALVKYEQNTSAMRIARDEMPPTVAYTENVHRLPPTIHTTHPSAASDGAQYVQSMLDAENAARAQRQLINNYNELDGVDQLVDTKLKALPNVGYEDMSDIQANMGHYGMDDLMDAPIAKDVPDPTDLIRTVADDPVMNSLEQQVKDAQQSWAATSSALEKRLTKEYKKQGLDPLDFDSDPEFAVPQAEHLYKMHELTYKQMKREAEITGTVDGISAQNFLSGRNLIKEHSPLLPQAKQDSWKFMFDDIDSMTKKPSTVPQEVNPVVAQLQAAHDEVIRKLDSLSIVSPDREPLQQTADMYERLMIQVHPSVLSKYSDDVVDIIKKGDPNDARVQKIWTEGQSAVPQESIINQQIQTTPKAGDMTMTGDADLSDAWQQGNETFDQMIQDPIQVMDNLEEALTKHIEPFITEGTGDIEAVLKASDDLVNSFADVINTNPQVAKQSAEFMKDFLNNGSSMGIYFPIEWDNNITAVLDDVITKADDILNKSVSDVKVRKATGTSLERLPEFPEGIRDYTMGSHSANALGDDAALHRDLIIMGEQDFKNLNRQLPNQLGESYHQMIRDGVIREGGTLPQLRALSFTDMDASGGRAFRSIPRFVWDDEQATGITRWYPNPDVKVTLVSSKLTGSSVEKFSVFKGEHEVIVPKWTKLTVDKITQDEHGNFFLEVSRVFDQPVVTPEDYITSKLQKGGELVWLHGTNVNDDVRRFIPENGSGTHELGLGLYLTADDRVAEAAAVKFRYENTPVNLDYQVGNPTVREMDVTNIRTVINLDDLMTKRQFNDLYGDALNRMHEPRDVADFYKFWRDNSDMTVGSVFDYYRLWLADTTGGVDELLNRHFQQHVYQTMKSQYDAGIKGGTLVVYDPSRLTNKGSRAIVRKPTDPVLDALNARHFLDEVASEQMGNNDVRRVVELQSRGDLVEYQKQIVSEKVAEEAVKQAEATKRITEADQNLRETVRKQEDAKSNRVEADINDGRKVENDMKPGDGVEQLMARNKDFRKFRGKLEQKLQKKIDRLANMGESKQGTKAARKLADEIKDLTSQIDSVDAAVNHYDRIFRSMNAEDIGTDWKDTLGTVLHQVDGHVLDPNWWVNRGEYLWNKSFQQFKDGFDHFIARYVSNFLGGDTGKIQRELYDLKRMGQGQFRLKLAQREAGKRVGDVQKEIHRMLKQYNLSDNDFARLFHDLAELQTSPYLIDDMKNANVNIYHYLSNKLNTEFSRYIDMGIPEDVMEAVAKKVSEIPQVYAEVKALAKELGITFGDEVILGYIPRQKKRVTEFWLRRGHKHEHVGADFMKSRKAFHWVPEDSQVVDVVLNHTNPKWKQTMSDALGKPVEHFDDLLGDDGSVLSVLVGMLDDDVLDMLNDMGILRKIPFTASESAEFLARKYQLPFTGLTDVYLTDPKRAMEMYSKGLGDRAAKNMTAYGLMEMPGFTMNINDMDEAAKAVFTVPFMEALPDALKGSLPQDFVDIANELRVHPRVADELRAMYYVTTNAGMLSMFGDVASLLYKFGSSNMLMSSSWAVNQFINNAATMVKRNMNPMPMIDFATRRLNAKLRGMSDITFDNTVKNHAGGTMTMQDVYEFAVGRGLIESGETYLGSATRAPHVPLKDMPKEMQRSWVEFFDFALQKGGHANEHLTAGQWLGGIKDRLMAGADTAIDHTTMNFVDIINRATDDGYKFALLEAVLRDPGTRAAIPGWNILGGVPHFSKAQLGDALRYVRENAYMFDEAQGGFETGVRYVMPFWSFHRLNIGETARWVASNPAKFGSYFRLYNTIQSGFNEEDSAAWESLHTNRFHDNQFSVPFKIPARVSQSGTDEIWTLPTTQLFPSAGAFTAVNDMSEILRVLTNGVIGGKINYDVGGEVEKPSKSVHNPFADDSRVDFQKVASPFARQILSLIDEKFLFDYDFDPVTADLDQGYPLGMDKKQYAMFKLWLPPMAKLLNALPTNIMGRAPELHSQTGEYTEGVQSAFTGQYPRRTSANIRNFFGENVLADTLKNMGLQPMPFDMYISQEFTMGNIQGQVSEAKSLMFNIRRELERSDPSDTAKYERLAQRAQETSLLYVHLKSEYELYTAWRKMNNIPHPRALRHIRKENLKVSDLLPAEERERIYKDNWDRYMNYFTY